MSHKEELINNIRHLIGQDELESAIDILSESFHGNEALDDLIMQSARYHNLQKELKNGTITGVEVKTELNTLRRNILTFLRAEEATLHDHTSDQDQIQAYRTDFLLSLTRVKVIKVLLSHDQQAIGLDITTLQRLSGIKRRKLVVDVLNELLEIEYLNKEKKEGKTCWRLSPEGVAFFEKFSLE